MTNHAFFGPPRETFVAGGAHIAVYLVPVFDGRLVVFDVTAEEARGRWLPWTVLEFGQNPYEAASMLVDDWCGGQISDLSLADVMSFPVGGGGWELSIVFRAELLQDPKGDEVRRPYIFEPGLYDAIGRFDPVDLERWVTRSAGTARTPQPAAPAAPKDPMVF
jgi:hypothetical protein